MERSLVSLVLVACCCFPAPAATIYVATNSLSDGPGTAWSNAWRSIQGAVDVASHDDTVLVTNGVYGRGARVTPGYSCLNRVVVTNSIVVRSMNGPEVTFIAEFLKRSVNQVRQKYMRREGLRTTIIEDPRTKDCIFLEMSQGQGICRIYPVRPNQCRTWPFWASNLASPNAWNSAAQNCPGINRGRLFTRAEIDALKKQKCWWADERHPGHCHARG